MFGGVCFLFDGSVFYVVMMGDGNVLVIVLLFGMLL